MGVVFVDSQRLPDFIKGKLEKQNGSAQSKAQVSFSVKAVKSKKSFGLQYDVNTTIKQVKSELSEKDKFDVAVDAIQLLLKGKTLVDYQTLANYELEGATVHLMEKKVNETPKVSGKNEIDSIASGLKSALLKYHNQEKVETFIGRFCEVYKEHFQ